mgnify:FL=1
MSENLINLLMSWGVEARKAASQVEYLAGSTVPFAIWETVYTTVLATLFAYIIGLPLGIILVTGEREGIRPLPPALMKILNTVVNLLRSVPFLILMVCVKPISRFILGTSIGTVASIVPLTLAAAPFVARVVESSLREMDRGVIEASQSMGCSPWQIVTKVMLPECRPSLITGLTTASITILSYGAMAGTIGGGGLGAMALLRGYGRQETVVLYVAVIFLVILVQIIQSIGTAVAVKTDRRIQHTQTKRRKGK